MDRTVIDTWKAEEKEICEKLHQKLSGLTLLHPPSEEFKKCFAEDMFVKPNQKGFVHVMHYLFNIYDPAEFKKRFYWPLLDKKTEANFRSSTVQYLNHLNEKHNLQWPSVKSYLVVMPGGMKFITFLSGFVDFVVRELIKQREKYLGIDVNDSGKCDDMNVKKLELQSKCIKKNSARYIDEIDLHQKKLTEISDNLSRRLDQLSAEITVPLSHILDGDFIESFEKDNQELFANNFLKNSTGIESFEADLNSLKRNIDDFQSQDTENIDINKDELKESFLTIQAMYPDLDVPIPKADAEIPMDDLVTIFNKIFPHIDSSMNSITRQSDESIAFEQNELLKIKSELIEIEGNVTKFLNSFKKESEEKSMTPLRNRPNFKNMLETRFVHTPTIRLDFNKGAYNYPRLPFLDDAGTNDRSTDSISFVAPKPSKRNESFQMPHSAKKSKIVDPMTLLRSLSKDTTISRSRNNSRNLSQLASKWKERELIFGFGDNAEQGPVIPTESQQKPPPSIYVSHSAAVRKNSDPSISDIRKKCFGVQKLQDDSFNILNLSTSPSGRLDPLVNFDQNELSKFGLGSLDSPMNKTMPAQGSDSFEALKLATPPSQKNQNRLVPKKDLDGSNNENDLNVTNLCDHFARNNISEGDTLFNISDSVLRDIPMNEMADLSESQNSSSDFSEAEVVLPELLTKEIRSYMNETKLMNSFVRRDEVKSLMKEYCQRNPEELNHTSSDTNSGKISHNLNGNQIITEMKVEIEPVRSTLSESNASDILDFLKNIEKRLSCFEEKLDLVYDILSTVPAFREKMLATQLPKELDSSDIDSINIEDEPQTEISNATIEPAINPYDDIYYEWRQHSMNMLRCKKSELTLQLNKRADNLQFVQPPIVNNLFVVQNVRSPKPSFIRKTDPDVCFNSQIKN